MLLCGGLRADDDVRLIADRALRAIGQRSFEDGADLTVTGSIGVVATADALADPGELLRQADMAMYSAKLAGRNRFSIFDPSLHAQAVASHDFDAGLRRAIEDRELFLVYQPLFSLEDQSMRGAEALVRWRHPDRGVLPPAEFIPLAEERGLIGAVGRLRLRRGVPPAGGVGPGGRVPRGLHAWRSTCRGASSRDPALVERVAATIRGHGLAPSQICIEVTETALIGEIGGAAAALGALSGLGVRLALDDFGTGYSSLAHVQRLNVDILKIDRSFVDQIGGSERDREIIGAITAMAHALGMSVVGEGIETDRQLGELTALGCDEGQGFLLARPLPPDQLVALSRAAGAARTPAGLPLKQPARL